MKLSNIAINSLVIFLSILSNFYTNYLIVFDLEHIFGVSFENSSIETEVHSIFSKIVTNESRMQKNI